MDNHIVETAFSEFSEVGKVAVLVELKVRLMADRLKGLGEYAHAHSVATAEEALLPYLLENKFVTEEEIRRITLSRKIRNKIFHCEFEKAAKLIEELTGEQLASGAVTGGKVSELPGNNILEKIMNLAESAKKGEKIPGSFKVDEKTTKEAGIFGWLIDGSARGLFISGLEAVQESLDVINRVFLDMAKRDFEKSSGSS